MEIRVFSDERCLLHRVPPGFPEIPRRLERVVDGLRASGVEIVTAGPHPAARDAVLALHDPAYVERFRHAVERGDGLLDSGDNPLSAGTWEAAWAAVEATLSAADWACQGSARAAFAAVRPPGHHAERGLAMGFCFFNNIAVAADHLRRSKSAARVAILDFDVHHGNGTQHLFEERADVFYGSLHQYPFYPGTGAAGERGRGEGAGTTLNLPLPAGSGDAAYLQALEEEMLPALRRFRPDLLLVSAGFDAWRGDPIGGMVVSRDGYRRWGELLAGLAAECCRGRIVSVLEGGYDLEALPGLASSYLEGLGSG